MIGYLDIETSFDSELTVVGVLRWDRGVVQLVGEAITSPYVHDLLGGLDTICTYNGAAFDLPVLDRALGLRLIESFRSLDLADECRRRRIRGGLKAIEQRFAIPRGLRNVNGYDAMLLWDRWTNGDREALETLLAYNRDDVVNLALLERRLRGDLTDLPTVATTVVGVSASDTGPSAAASHSPGRGTR